MGTGVQTGVVYDFGLLKSRVDDIASAVGAGGLDTVVGSVRKIRNDLSDVKTWIYEICGNLKRAYCLPTH